MTETRQAFHRRNSGLDWRGLLGDSFVLAGTLVLFTTMLFWVRSAMAAQQDGFQPYLVSSVEFQLPLPSTTPAAPAQPEQQGEQAPANLLESPLAQLATPLATQTAQGITPAGEVPASAAPTASLLSAEQPQATPAAATESGTPVSSEQPALTETAQPILSETPQQPAPEQMYPAPENPEGAPPIESPASDPAMQTPAAPVQVPSSGPVVRLVIPRLQVNRAVVPVELRGGGNGNPEWNTDALFSTPNRPDLVGQLAVSANPGEGGNIILVGHNYNNGWYDWEGVFVRLGSMQAGDTITLYTENGAEFQYIVEKVKKVPWQKRNLAELEKHQKFLWPTGREQLTLVTCGGTVLWTWQARIYVVAVPVVQPSP